MVDDRVKVRRCLEIMEELGRSDPFWEDALDEYRCAEEKGEMERYLVGIYNDARDNGVSLELALVMCSFAD